MSHSTNPPQQLPVDSTPTEPLWVLVTGGAKRLGRATCLAFARAGWNVVCHYQQSAQAADETEKECQALNASGKAHAIRADLSNPQEAQRLLPDLAAQGMHIHSVVNNASAFTPDTGLTMDVELLQQQLMVNTISPLVLGKELALLHKNSANVANTAKHQPLSPLPCAIHILDQKVYNLNPDYFSYTISKLALERSVKLQAQALAPHIRVAGIAPGLLYPSGPQSQSNFDRASTKNLHQHAINPDDVARTAVFLASTASINGSIVSVDCGQHLVPLGRDVMFVVDEENPGI